MIGKYTLSLAMIGKNEADCIGKCLDSVMDIVDELIFVDTGSTDDTKEIVGKYPKAKIYEFPWIDDFAAARNVSFQHCTSEICLWLDCDDIVYPEDLAKMKALDLSDKEIVICNYEYSHDEFGNSVCTVPRERIIKRSLGLKWEQPIHEYLPLLGKQFISDISIHHFKKGGTSERNLRILQKIVEKNPMDSRNVYYLGKEFLDFGRVDEGIPQLEEFVRRADGFWEDIYTAHYRLAQAYLGKNDERKFKEHLFRSIELEDRRAEPYYLMGQYYERKNMYDKAIMWYEFCTCIERPKNLLASHQPEYYTWLPRLQLTVCMNMLGRLEDALYWNNAGEKFRPGDTRFPHNRAILESAIKERKLKQRKDGELKKLNLGCGGKAEPGYTNVDLFKGPAVDEVFEFDEIPYFDGTIQAINSEHSLEHVGWARAEKALREWFRVLKPGGQLLLKIPDFEECCKKYLATPDDNKKHKQWYKYTIYGVQKSQGGEPDDAQYHRAGWSKKEMCDILQDIGFIIDYSYNYDGWDTPSAAFLAVKPVSVTKVGWIAPLSWEAAQTRIRVLTVNRWLRSKGYKSDVVNYTDIINQNYDICIVGKGFDEHHFKNIRMLKQHRKTVICDLCEDIITFPWVKEILQICDLVVCCSRELARRVKEQANPNVAVIEDAYEL